MNGPENDFPKVGNNLKPEVWTKKKPHLREASFKRILLFI